MKIAVYAIALNEIKHVERWVKATKDADYRIVADTGSTDGTVEKLRELGVTVHNIVVKPWRFDDARNASLALVPADADVCLQLDMDEVPASNFFKLVRKHWQPQFDHAWITMQTGVNKWQRDRLHSRFNWRWKYPCHEVNVWTGDRIQVLGDISQAVIKHLPDDSKSRGQYLGLLEVCVKEYPQDPRMWCYMTREYYFYHRWEDVITSAQKMLDCPNGWDVEQAAVCRWAGEAAHQLGRTAESTEWYTRGVQILPKQGESKFGVCMDAYRNKDWQRCLDAALDIFLLPRSVHYCYESEVWDWKAYDLASIACWNLRLINEAALFASKAVLAKGPETERIQRNLDLFRKAQSEL